MSATTYPAESAPPGWSRLDPTQNVTQYSYPFCNLTVARDLARPPAFRSSGRLQTTNEIALRFGASNDMITLLEGTPNEQEEYLKGLFATSVLVAFFFLLWCFIMLVFKCTGQRCFGFLSGRFIRPSPPPLSVAPLDPNKSSTTTKRNGSPGAEEESHESIYLVDYPPSPVGPVGPQYNFGIEQEPQDQLVAPPKTPVPSVAVPPSKDDYQEWVAFCVRQKRRHIRVRWVVIISCLGVITACILFTYYGNYYIVESMNFITSGLRQIQDLCTGAIGLIDTFLVRQEAAVQNVQASFAAVNGICPNQREQICSVIEPAIENCSFAGIPGVEESLSDMFTLIYTKRAYAMNELNKTRNDLDSLYNDIDEFLDKEQNLNLLFWLSFGFCLALSLCAVGMMWGIMFRNACQLKCCRRRLLLPLFCILVIFAYLCCILFLIGAVGASDFCINSPDTKVSYIIDQLRANDTSIVYDFAYYYVNRCPTERAPVQIELQETRFFQVLSSVTSFSQSLQGFNSQAFNAACGTDGSELRAFGTLVEEVTCLLANTLQDFQRFMWCRNWTPMYLTFMDEAICLNAQKGLAWIASTSFCMVAFSLVVLLCRAGAFDIEDETKHRRLADAYRKCCYSLAMSIFGPRKRNRTSQQYSPTPQEQSPSGMVAVGGLAKRDEHESFENEHNRMDNYDDQQQQPYYDDQQQQEPSYDDEGRPFYYDDQARPYYYDDQGLPYYYDDQGQPYYYDDQGQPYFYDDQGQPQYYDDQQQQQYYDDQQQQQQPHYDDQQQQQQQPYDGDQQQEQSFSDDQQQQQPHETYYDEHQPQQQDYDEQQQDYDEQEQQQQEEQPHNDHQDDPNYDNNRNNNEQYDPHPDENGQNDDDHHPQEHFESEPSEPAPPPPPPVVVAREFLEF